jgi:hypothetical protein
MSAECIYIERFVLHRLLVSRPVVMSIRQDDDEQAVQRGSGFSLRSIFGGMRFIDSESDTLPHSQMPSFSQLSSDMERTIQPVSAPMSSSHEFHTCPEPQQTLTPTRGFKFNLGAKTHELNQMFANDNAQTLPPPPDDGAFDLQMRPGTNTKATMQLTPNMTPIQTAHSMQLQQLQQPQQPQQPPQRMQPMQPMRTTSSYNPPQSFADVVPQQSDSIQLSQAKTQVTNVTLQLEESKRRFLMLQRKYDQDRKVASETLRAMQDTMESYRRHAEQSKHDLLQLQTTITTNKSAEQSALVARDSQLIELRQKHTQEMNALKENHLEAMRQESEKMMQASYELSALNTTNDVLVQKNCQLEHSLQQLKTENESLRPPTIAEPLLPPSYNKEVVNSQLRISKGCVSVSSEMNDMTIKTALSKDLSEVVMNAFRRRQKHGLISDVIINS